MQRVQCATSVKSTRGRALGQAANFGKEQTMTKKFFITLTALLAVPLLLAAVDKTEPRGVTTTTSSGSGARATSGFAATDWQSPARLRHWVTKTQGILKIDEQGIEFQPAKGPILKWALPDVQTFFISPRRLVIETYENRGHHVPGEQRYRFDLVEDVPPGVAKELAQGVQRPSQNAIPDPPSNAENIPAHHRTLTGGTNGTLRVRGNGIDYVTRVPGDSRSWRWTDLETLSNPDPYHLFVFGYRDTYTFDLKSPFSPDLFNRLTDEIYSHQSPAPETRVEGVSSDRLAVKRTGGSR